MHVFQCGESGMSRALHAVSDKFNLEFQAEFQSMYFVTNMLSPTIAVVQRSLSLSLSLSLSPSLSLPLPLSRSLSLARALDRITFSGCDLLEPLVFRRLALSSLFHLLIAPPGSAKLDQMEITFFYCLYHPYQNAHITLYHLYAIPIEPHTIPI